MKCVCLFLCLFVGCASQPAKVSTAQQLTAAWQAYNATLDGMEAAASAGAMTPEDIARAAPYLEAAYAALVKADADAAAGRSPLQADIDAAVTAAAHLAPLIDAGKK